MSIDGPGSGPSGRASGPPSSLGDKDRYAELARLLRDRRRQLGLTRRELIEATGLSYPYVAQLEGGYRAPSLATAGKLAEALGLTADRIAEAAGAAEGSGSSREPDSEAADGSPSSPRRISDGRSTGDGADRAPRTSATVAARYVHNPTYAARITTRDVRDDGGGQDAHVVQGAAHDVHDKRNLRASVADTLSMLELVETVVDVLAALPPERRLDALGLVQSRVMAALVDEQVRRATET